MVEFIFVACFHKFNSVLWVKEIGFVQSDVYFLVVLDYLRCFNMSLLI